MDGLFTPEHLMSSFRSRFFTLLQNFVLFLIVSILMRDPRCAKQALLAFSISAFSLSVLTHFGFGLTSVAVEAGTLERSYGEGLGIGITGYLTAISSVCLIGFIFTFKNTKQSWQRVLLFVMTIPILALLVGTASRTAMVGGILGLTVYLVPFSRAGKKTTALIWTILALSLFMYGVVNDPVSSLRWEKTIEEGHMSGRQKIWVAAKDLILEEPLFGWGVAESQQILGRELGRSKRDPHNVFLKLLLENGLIGALPMLVTIFLCVREAWRSRAGFFGLMPIALLMPILVHFMSAPMLNRKLTWLVLGFCIASVSIRVTQKRRFGKTN